MHEMSVAQRIIDTVSGYGALRHIFISVGLQSCVHPRMLLRAYEQLKPMTSARAAKLHMNWGTGEDIQVLYIEVENARDTH